MSALRKAYAAAKKMKKPRKVRSDANRVRKSGRGRDDQLVHMDGTELDMLRHAWGPPGRNPHTGLPDYSWLSDAIHHPGDVIKGSINPLTLADSNIAKNSNIAPANLRKMMAGLDDAYSAGWDQLKHDPWRIFTGIDPISTGISNKVLGRNDAALTNMLGSPSNTTWEKAQQKDPDLDFTRAHDFAKIGDAIAGIVGGGALSGALGGGSSAAAPGAASDTGLGAAMDGLSGTGAATAETGLDAAAAGGSGLADATLPEIVVQGTRTAGGSGLNALGSGAGAAAGAFGDPGGPNESGMQNGPNPNDPKGDGILSKAGKYIKDPKNWNDIAKGAGVIGSLVKKATDGGGSSAPPGAPGGPVQQYDFNRSQNPYGDDYYTYGTRAMHNWFNNNYTPAGGPGGANTGHAMGGVINFHPYTSAHVSSLRNLTRRHLASGSAVRGPGTGRSDDIPARLSDGEYVFDAETTALLGDGSSEAGAAKLDEMREAIRKHKGSALSQGKFSPAAKSPLSYLKGMNTKSRTTKRVR